jgi:hypothetical protein
MSVPVMAMVVVVVSAVAMTVVIPVPVVIAPAGNQQAQHDGGDGECSVRHGVVLSMDRGGAGRPRSTE